MKDNKGITLIALIITIIVLIILAGITIGALTTNNGVLKQSSSAKKETIESSESEKVKLAVMDAIASVAQTSTGELTTESVKNGIKGQFGDGEEDNVSGIGPWTYIGPDTGKEYNIEKDGNFNEVQVADRTGISVGDYISYTSPTESVTFTNEDTGYSTYSTSPATLNAKTLFRVLDIDNHGNIMLIGAMISTDPTIYFSGAGGYNNAVYTLNEKCSELYKDTSRGITARSIKVEDITDKFNQTGTNKLTMYISNQISSLSPDTDVTKNADSTVTYNNGNTKYPDLFQYEEEGLIDGIQTSGIIGQSESYSGYNGLTSLTSVTPKPTSLTVPYTYYNTIHTSADFEDETKAEAYQQMFFGTETYFWLASRVTSCTSTSAFYNLRRVKLNAFEAMDLWVSNGNSRSNCSRVCPIVYIPASVRITVSTDDSAYHQTVPHVVQ